jgi:hypothetical protein
LPTIALVHPDHGTHFVYSEGAVEEYKKLGWTVRPDDWKERARAENEARLRAAKRAEMERLAAELGEPVPEAPKRGRPRKVA